MTDYQECLELFCINRLNCDAEDLKKLEEVYSDLATSISFEVDESTDDLGELLYDLYECISLSVSERLTDLCDAEEPIEYINSEDNTVVLYRIKGDFKLKLLEVANEIENAKPTTYNPASIKFNSVLDNCIDFDDDLEYNAERLIRYLIKNKLVEVGKEYEEEE